MSHYHSDKKIYIAMIAAALVAILVVSIAGSTVTSHYRANMAINSAALLGEYGSQVAASVQGEVDRNWDVAKSVADTLEVVQLNKLNDLLPVLDKIRSSWGLSDIVLYAENGFCINSQGESVSLDDASEIIYQTIKQKKFVSTMGSKTYFSISVDTTLTLNNSRIVAVSVVQNQRNVISDLKITSFHNSTTVFLTQGNGLIVSRSSNAPKAAINVATLYPSDALKNLNKGSNQMEEALSSHQIAYFLYKEAGGTDKYVVALPLSGTFSNLNIVFSAPVSEVDHSMNEFSAFLIRLYLALAVVIVLLMCSVFYGYMKQRMRNYNDILVRERMLDLLITNTNDVFYLFSPRQDNPSFVSANEGAKLGASGRLRILSDWEGHILFASSDPSDQQSIALLNGALKSWSRKGEFISDYLPFTVKGQKKHFTVRIYPTEQQEEQYIAILADVTKEQEREQALKDALAIADEASKAKSRFLANMSHDIRTPMNAIVNMTEFALQSGNRVEEIRGYLETIKTSSGHLIQLINDVLDMSRIESGKTRVEIESFDINSRLDQIEGIVQPLCMARSQDFVCIYSIRHQNLLGDQLKLNQILINLLNNAVKFTPGNGRIEFSVEELSEIAENQTSFCFSVVDNGIGIAPHEIDKIFAPFNRSEQVDAEQVEGTGLGLSICKSFVEAMGGRISVKSELGIGSSFAVTLPFEIAQEREEKREFGSHGQGQNYDFTGLRALLCEDNEINRQIACLLLRKLGFEVEMENDGQSGYQSFVRSEPGWYDIIFMDIQMPNMNGYETTKAIRASAHPQAETIPIVAMTANVFKEDVEKARDAGMSAHVGKPLEINAIMRASQFAIEREKEKECEKHPPDDQ